MTTEEMTELSAGDFVVYDDGREGNSGVRAVVLTNSSYAMQVQFDDRADSTFIRHSDRGWTDHLKVCRAAW
ncbi:MAG: hypothetical protein FIA89_01785 [Geobacter sp.]|nr:hypothetical protein [Geobacter sp.]